MIIGIDGNEANMDNRVGVHQYGYELFWALFKQSEQWKDKHQIVVYLKSPPKRDLPKATSFWQYKVLPGGRVWIISRLMPELFKNKRSRPDIFFTPGHYIPLVAPMPRVCSIMDLGYLEFTGQFRKYDFWQLKLWSAYSIIFSKRVIAISQSTKKDIVRHYPISSKKVDVTYLGYDKEQFNLSNRNNDVRRIKQKYGIEREYLIFISTLKPSKNIEGLLSAWSMIENKYPKYTLVIAGKKGWFYESIFQIVKELGINDRVIFTDYVPEEDKPALIAGARLFVLPSFWEGFGLDVLSAMACGVPVVVSRKGSLPEVAGNPGVYIDPENYQSIASGIEKVLDMRETDYDRLRKESVKQANAFSWEKTARQTLDILEEAAA